MQFLGVAAETIDGWLVCCAAGIVQCLLNVLLYAIWVSWLKLRITRNSLKKQIKSQIMQENTEMIIFL